MWSAPSDDTIFAPASAIGRAAIAIVRISGPAAAVALARLSGMADTPAPRRATLRTLLDPAGEPLDKAIVLFCPSPSTVTGEDIVELHLHGGSAVRSAVLAALGAVPGLRLAEPGEFTRRAFLNGKLDLTEVEGLADLIDAETEGQRRQALRQLDGEVGRAVVRWREALLDALAQLESSMDFSDERDIPDDVAAPARVTVARVSNAMEALLARGRFAERVREGFTVVIAGPPNAGKSTLLNAIARRDVAIVSDRPGTTRDALELRCDLAGLPVTFVDTAGLRESADTIEQEGVRRSLALAGGADLVLVLADGSQGTEAAPLLDADPGRMLHVTTKADLGRCYEVLGGDVAVSALTGAGLPELLALVADRLRAGRSPGDAGLTRERHRMAVAEARAALERALAQDWEAAPELVAEDLRAALFDLGRLVGQVGVDDVLDRIFDAFCIGK